MSANPARARRDWLPLLVLLGLVVCLRGWLLFNTEVTARDSIGYIRYALDFERLGWTETLRRHHQNPGYSFTVWAVSVPIRVWRGGTDPYGMQLAAQLASSLAALLLVVPMYLAGKMLFDRQAAFWGTLFFQFMPVSGHHLSDGISEACFLLWATTALYFGLRALRRQEPLDFAVSGAATGLAYLTRPEGALLLCAAGFVLVARQLSRNFRQSWPRLVGQSLCLCLPALAVGSLYFGFTHKFTNKPSFHIILRTAGADAPPEPGRPPGPPWACCFAGHYDADGSFLRRLGDGFAILAMELLQIFHYWGSAGLALGIVWYGPRLVRRGAIWLPLVYLGMHGMVVMALAVKAGYLSDRHLMILTVWGSFFAAAGLRDVPARWRQWCSSRPRFAVLGPTAGALFLPLLFVVSCLPQTLQRIHHNRLGNHEAGLWLAQRLQEGDMVVDDHCWSHYYAGLVLREHRDTILPAEARPTCYVVMTRSRDRDIDKQRRQDEDKLAAAGGKIVYHWPAHADASRARIVVYALPRNPQTHPWRTAPPRAAAIEH